MIAHDDLLNTLLAMPRGMVQHVLNVLVHRLAVDLEVVNADGETIRCAGWVVGPLGAENRALLALPAADEIARQAKLRPR